MTRFIRKWSTWLLLGLLALLGGAVWSAAGDQLLQFAVDKLTRVMGIDAATTMGWAAAHLISLIIAAGTIAAAYWIGWIKRDTRQLAEYSPISPRQKQTLIESLRDRGFGDALQDAPVDVRYAANCPSCKAYATQMADAFVSAGWHGDIGLTGDEIPDLTGVRLYLEDIGAKPRSADVLANALLAAGVDFDWWQNQSLGGHVIVFVYPRRAT